MMAQVIQAAKDLGLWEPIQIIIIMTIVLKFFHMLFGRD